MSEVEHARRPEFGVSVRRVIEADIESVVEMVHEFAAYEEAADQCHLTAATLRTAHRGGGHGRALLAELAAECVRHGYTRLQWSALDWNTPALEFYPRARRRVDGQVDCPAAERGTTQATGGYINADTLPPASFLPRSTRPQ